MENASAEAPVDRPACIERISLGGNTLQDRYRLGGDVDVRPYFPRPWDGDAILDRRIAPLDRVRLADILVDQNRRWQGGAQSLANAAAIAHDATRVVVTGQQVGLALGPLFTVYKAVTAIQQARRLARERGGAAVVPVFWMATEDHDLAEVLQPLVLQSDLGAWNPLAIARPPGMKNAGAVGRLMLPETIEGWIQNLPMAGADFAEDVRDVLQACYKPGVTFADAFATLLHRLLPDSGIVIIDADHPELKAMAAPVWEQALSEPDRIMQALAGRTWELEARFAAPLRLRPPHLFLLDDEGRHAIDVDHGVYSVAGRAGRFSYAEIRAQCGASWQHISPNVVLRPLYQDFLLPNVAYVAGPGEVAYFAQIAPAYEALGLDMPTIWPRGSYAWLTPSLGRVLRREGLSINDVAADPMTWFKSEAIAHLPVDTTALLSTLRRDLERALAAFERGALAVHPDVHGASAVAAARIDRIQQYLARRLTKAARKRNATFENRILKLRNHAFPQGRPQERIMSALSLVAYRGLGVFRTAPDWLDEDPTVQHVYEIP